jgi:alkylated DNA repair dioxygenase AlkB
MDIEIAPGHVVSYVEGFYAGAEADDLLRALLTLDMTNEEVRLYGSTWQCRRKTLPVGIDYVYNPSAKPAIEWTPLMRDIRERVETAVGRVDGGLVQLYPDGQAAIGWHSDKHTPEVIASLSFGAERDFAFGTGPSRHCKEVRRLRLAHGSLLVIPGVTNGAFKHRLLTTARVRAPRVNVTLRRFPDI